MYKNSFENDLSFELTTEDDIDDVDDSDDVSEHELLVFLVVQETEETEEEAEVGELGSRGCFLAEEKEREEAGGGAREITSLSSTWLGSTWCFLLRLHLLMQDPMDMNWGREWE